MQIFYKKIFPERKIQTFKMFPERKIQTFKMFPERKIQTTIKKPCGEPQGEGEKLYILEDCLSNIIGSAGEYLSNNAYKSKLFSSNKNWRKPSIKIPSSLRRGRISSFTTIIFLNESGIARKGRSSCLTFSSDGKAYAD